jgi:hypothetical protein
MITNLVVNGCSYMATYAEGLGHRDLGKRLGLFGESITVTGSANSRILRTTLKHSYETDKKCLYVLGMTFISREELPICRYDEYSFPTEKEIWEGAWTNPQNQLFGKNRWTEQWSDNDTKNWIVFRQKYEQGTMVDRLENLMYQMLAVRDSLTHRGHNCIIFQQADHWWDGMLLEEYDRIRLLNNKNILGDFKWCAIREQHNAGVAYVSGEENVPEYLRHRSPHKHEWLNNYLEQYVRQHELHL